MPRYKNVPVSAPWYRWRAWQWQPARSVVDKGTNEAPTWPDETRIALGVGCGPGEQERARRESKYQISFEDEDREVYRYEPRSLDEFMRLPAGATAKLRVGPTQTPQIVTE